MYMCEECNYVWDVQRSIGNPDVRQCPKCLSYEIEETSPSNVPQGQANDREHSAYVQLADVLEIVDDVLNTIPFYAYGDNEAAVRMIEALHKIRDKVLEHVG